MSNEIISYISSASLPTTKNAVVAMLNNVSRTVVSEMRENPKHTIQYYNALSMLLSNVTMEIASRNLFDAPQEWFFSFEISNKNAALYLKHVAELQKADDKSILLDIDEMFRLVNYPVKLLTVEDYAKISKIAPVTVRQWIRRGKIRSAIKIGGEWRIPEITDPPTRGYTPVRYYNSSGSLLPFPEELGFPFNQQPSVIDIYQAKDKKGYVVLFDYAPAFLPQRLLTDAEREKLELMLISNTNITNSSAIVGTWPKVKETEKLRTIVRSGGMQLPEGWDINLF